MPEDREEMRSKLNTASAKRWTHGSDVSVSFLSSTLHSGLCRVPHSLRGWSPFNSTSLSFREPAKGNSFHYSCQTGITNNGKNTINYYSSFNRYARLTNPTYKVFL